MRYQVATSAPLPAPSPFSPSLPYKSPLSLPFASTSLLQHLLLGTTPPPPPPPLPPPPPFFPATPEFCCSCAPHGPPFHTLPFLSCSPHFPVSSFTFSSPLTHSCPLAPLPTHVLQPPVPCSPAFPTLFCASPHPSTPSPPPPLGATYTPVLTESDARLAVPHPLHDSLHAGSNPYVDRCLLGQSTSTRGWVLPVHPAHAGLHHPVQLCASPAAVPPVKRLSMASDLQ